MDSHSEIEALRAITITNNFMIYALMKTHPDPTALRNAFLEMARVYLDTQHARGDSEICLKSLGAQIDSMERLLVDQSLAAQR